MTCDEFEFLGFGLGFTGLGLYSSPLPWTRYNLRATIWNVPGAQRRWFQQDFLGMRLAPPRPVSMAIWQEQRFGYVAQAPIRTPRANAKGPAFAILGRRLPFLLWQRRPIVIIITVITIITTQNASYFFSINRLRPRLSFFEARTHDADSRNCRSPPLGP